MSFFKELKRRNVFRVGIAYTVATWLLIQVTDTVFPRIGLPDSAVTLVIALLLIGFIPALIFAWAFEMTPEGLKRERDIDRSQSITPETGKNLNRMIIAGLALVIVVMGVERLWFAGQDEEPSDEQTIAEVATTPNEEQVATAQTVDDRDQPADARESVAVLPFAAMSSGEDDGYFADGLTEEILNSLARLPELLVTARTSSFHFKGKDLPIPETAAILGVRHVVEGSVRRSGNQVRITAQLIRAEDGFHLWSDTYDRTLEDIFTVQEDIAENIAETLDVVLNEDKRQKMKRAGIGNVEAFIAYQKALEMSDKAHSISDPIELLPEANRYYDQALAIVPDIPGAHLERTDLFGHMIYNNAGGMSSFSEEELKAAMAELQKGLTQAIRYANSSAQRAYIEAERAEFSDDWSSIPSWFDQAFQTTECYSVVWAASLAAVFGWAEEVAAHYERLRRCDPLTANHVSIGGQFSIWAGEAESALEFTEDYLESVEFNPWVEGVRLIALQATGRYRDEPDAYGPNPEGSYSSVPRSVFFYALDNDPAKAREVLATALETSSVGDMELLIVEAALGNRDAANAYASKLDARFAGPFILVEAIKGCYCGAPFDLEATPNFKARIEEAGFQWPPPSPINYPAKDW